jgi:two-component system CheB/CheR fusion protein
MGDAPNRAAELPRPIVGIGASAGGLGAFKAFFAAMPPDSGIGFVIVQHLDPSHKSILTELVGRQTPMPVVEAQDGMPVAANRVHIIPPDATLTIAKGILRVDRPAPPRQRRFPIDTFFESLAQDQGENAAGIVMSGIGSDGTLGVKMLKEHGGLTLAQSEHDQLAMTGMPQSAAATGLVDNVLRVEDMPARLLEYQQHLLAAAGQDDGGDDRQVTARQMATITALLRSGLGHDFANYNENTLSRRIQRRMQVLHIDKVQQYIVRVRNDPRERDLLFQELLINVTEFFRDPAAFEELETGILPTLLANKTDADQVRIWVPGCATGEEVYSIAILVKEEMDRRAINPQVQIFGTDIDEGAIAVARSGRYPKPRGSLSAERLARWFVAETEGYRIVRQIREMCVFSAHSVVKDPPFSKLDLVSCRNLLIYLNPDLQERVVRMFHYALRPGGFLFLGPAEGVTRGAHLFETIDATCRLFRRRDTVAATHFPDFRSSEEARADPARPASSRLTDRIEKVAHAVLERHSPAYVVVNRQNDIIRFSGGEIGRYLEPSAGIATLGLFGILRRSLRQTVRAALEQSIATKHAVVRKLRIKLGGETRAINVIVEPITVDGPDATMSVVAFQDLGPVAETVRARNAAEPRDAIVRELEEELSGPKNNCRKPWTPCRVRSTKRSRAPKNIKRSTRNSNPRTKNWKPPRRRCSPSTRNCRPSTPSSAARTTS